MRVRLVLPDGEGSVYMAKRDEPGLPDGFARVRTVKSVISSGTELSMIDGARGKSRGEIEASGVRLGYCSAGIVEEVSGDLSGIVVGDRVACYGGPYVLHGDYASIPKRLLKRIAGETLMEHAAFMGLGAIALHGLRLGRIDLGGVAVVVGAGLLGNLCAQLALNAGAEVVACDPREDRLELLLVSSSSQQRLYTTKPEQVGDTLKRLPLYGLADVVYLCLASKSPDSWHAALEWVRPGGTIVVVGALPMDYPRETAFYKEVNVVASRAAGPGRYDPKFERDGVDYPLQYVRWTEERNCETALRLIESADLNVGTLISRVMPANRVADAYLALRRGEVTGTIVLDWAE